MGTKLNRSAYERMIAENVEWLSDKGSPHSLEKKHIIDVLKWSIDALYPTATVEADNARLRAALEKIVCYDPNKGMVKIAPHRAVEEIHVIAREALEGKDGRTN